MAGLLRPSLAFVPASSARQVPAAAIDSNPAATASSARSLKILHILRAPVGGLFRHVLDITQGQIERGHRVGLIADSITGGARAQALLEKLAPRLALGVQRIAISRHLSFQDLRAWRQVAQRVAALAPDVLHGHGAKGAALARLVPHGHAIRVYTPHGGSLVYSPGTVVGGIYRRLEQILDSHTDLFLFESSYIAEVYRAAIGAPRALVRIVRNGVGDADFTPVVANGDAADIVCVGELRNVKGFDVLIEAVAMLKRGGRTVHAVIAGEGPDQDSFKALVQRRDLNEEVCFVGHRPAREAFAMGRIMVVPSRAESLPYVVLEAAAAAIPIIATRVGGIPEIFGEYAPRLVPVDDAAALAGAIRAALDQPSLVKDLAQALQERVRREFSVAAMVDGGLAAYRDAIAVRKSAAVT